MIPNKRPASEYRVRTLDRNDLNEKGKIYICKGGTTTVDGVTGVYDIEAKNIITAINENATDKTIEANILSGKNGIESNGDIKSTKHSIMVVDTNGTPLAKMDSDGNIFAASFKGNADSATNATNATNAANATYATSATNATNATYAIYAQYASTDRAKGTIEDRLTNLGFKSGSATIASGSASPNNLYRQGNYVYGRIGITGATRALNATWFTLPQNFRPKTAFTTSARGQLKGMVYTDTVTKETWLTLKFNTDGTVIVTEADTSLVEHLIGITKLNAIQFGFEAPAIT